MPRRVWLVTCLAVVDGLQDQYASMRVVELGDGPQIDSEAAAIRLVRAKMIEELAEKAPGRVATDWTATEES